MRCDRVFLLVPSSQGWTAPSPRLFCWYSVFIDQRWHSTKYDSRKQIEMSSQNWNVVKIEMTRQLVKCHHKIKISQQIFFLKSKMTTQPGRWSILQILLRCDRVFLLVPSSQGWTAPSPRLSVSPPPTSPPKSCGTRSSSSLKKQIVFKINFQ